MALDPKEARFLRKRAMLVRIWPAVGGLLLLGLAVFGLWLWWTQPLLIDPGAFVGALEAETLSRAEIILMAGFLPLAMLSILFLLFFLVALLFSVYLNERKYLALLGRLSDNPRGNARGNPRGNDEAGRGTA